MFLSEPTDETHRRPITAHKACHAGCRLSQQPGMLLHLPDLPLTQICMCICLRIFAFVCNNMVWWIRRAAFVVISRLIGARLLKTTGGIISKLQGEQHQQRENFPPRPRAPLWQPDQWRMLRCPPHAW